MASMRLTVRDRAARGRGRRTLRDELVAEDRAHLEYGRRARVAGVDLLLHVTARRRPTTVCRDCRRERPR